MFDRQPPTQYFWATKYLIHIQNQNQSSQVTQGNRPVKKAEVTATIEGVGGNSHTFELWDNGAGADLIANDGVYSRFFFTTDNDTFYTVSCLARSSGSAEVLEGLVNQGRNSTDI